MYGMHVCLLVIDLVFVYSYRIGAAEGLGAVSYYTGGGILL